MKVKWLRLVALASSETMSWTVRQLYRSNKIKPYILRPESGFPAATFSNSSSRPSFRRISHEPDEIGLLYYQDAGRYLRMPCPMPAPAVVISVADSYTAT